MPYLCKEERRIWIGLTHAVQMAYQAGRRMKNAFRKEVNMSSPTLQMMCPGVLQVNVCTNREGSKDLSDGRENTRIVPLRNL